MKRVGKEKDQPQPWRNLAARNRSKLDHSPTLPGRKPRLDRYCLFAVVSNKLYRSYRQANAKFQIHKVPPKRKSGRPAHQSPPWPASPVVSPLSGILAMTVQLPRSEHGRDVENESLDCMREGSRKPGSCCSMQSSTGHSSHLGRLLSGL